MKYGVTYLMYLNDYAKYFYTTSTFVFQQKEIEIRRQFRDTINIQRQQYKEYKAQILAKTPKEEQRSIIKRLKEDQRRKLAMLGDQYEQSIAEMLQRQSLRLDESQVRQVHTTCIFLSW